MDTRYNKNWNNMRGGGRGGSNRGSRGRNQRGFRGGHRTNYRDPRGGSWIRESSSGWNGNPGGFRGGRQQDDLRNPNKQWQKRPRREAPTKRLSEDAIGVTEYVSPHEGFNGVIKSRYSDFQVSEIDERGVVAKLTDLAPPTPPVDEVVEEDEQLLFNKYNLELLPMEIWDKINKLAVSTEKINEPVELDANTMSKEQRTKIHDAVKKAFGNNIVSSTVNLGEKKLVRFEKYRKGVRIDKRVKWMWPAEYVYFIVHKENCDTMEAATRIAERMRLNIKPSLLGYAGTKDRRAKTSQWFSLRKVDPRKIATACKDLRDIRVGNFEFRPHNLKLGMLKGNQFRIVLRNVTAGDEVVFKACEELKERGFLNYYGLQRFGTRLEAPTYHIGLKLLQGKYQEAIDGILLEREGPLQGALQAYASEGAGAALRVWPHRAPHSALEGRLLTALAAQPNDLLGALNKLARNSRLLYVHSYQSLVWNRCVSERLRRFGLRPHPGDIVPTDKDIDVTEEILKEEEDLEDDEDETDSESREETSQNDDLNKTADPKANLLQNNLETSIKQAKTSIPVKVLTQEDVDSGKYTMFDVILPLPGNSIEYPPNMIDYYEELLKNDGLELQMKHKVKSYAMSGTYRHVVVRPVGMAWRSQRYSDPRADLVLSDWDLLNDIQLTGADDDGKYKALILTMTLPASCYATMALRELLKIDTSCDNQASLNNYHQERSNGDTTQNSTDEKKSEDMKPAVKTETEDGARDKRKAEGEGEVEVKKLKQELE